MKKINKVVIPIAGFGSRMFPVTLGISKAMLPILNKPVIQYLIEECVSASIFEIIIIMSEFQDDVKKYLTLNNKYAIEKFKDNQEVKNLVDLLKSVKITFVIQKEQKGLGHAIYCAKEYVGDEDFAVILGDNPVLGEKEQENGIKQLHNKYIVNNGYYIGVKKVELEDTKKYGIVSAIDYACECFQLNGMIEKPLSNPPSQYAALGRYVLKNSIFKYLENTKPGANNEIQITDAIKTAIDNELVYGAKLNGTCYDTGNVDGFIKTNLEYFEK